MIALYVRIKRRFLFITYYRYRPVTTGELVKHPRVAGLVDAFKRILGLAAEHARFRQMGAHAFLHASNIAREALSTVGEDVPAPPGDNV